jgi:UDP-N-acetylglucosamine enolpyruvyl transferase
MVKMGVKYENTNGNYVLQAEKLVATEVRQWFPSVTGTENLILLAVLTP